MTDTPKKVEHIPTLEETRMTLENLLSRNDTASLQFQKATYAFLFALVTEMTKQARSTKK